MQTTMMRANITAYSTAVGPSSFFRNDTSFFAMLRISNSYGGGAEFLGPRTAKLRVAALAPNFVIDQSVDNKYLVHAFSHANRTTRFFSRVCPEDPHCENSRQLVCRGWPRGTPGGITCGSGAKNRSPKVQSAKGNAMAEPSHRKSLTTTGGPGR